MGDCIVIPDTADPKYQARLKMEESVNRFLTVTLYNRCWHEYTPVVGEEYSDSSNVSFKGCDIVLKCRCGDDVVEGSFLCKEDAEKALKRMMSLNPPRPYRNNKNFFTEKGFFLLKNKIVGEGWHQNFIEYCFGRKLMSQNDILINIDFNTFPLLVARYLGWREGDDEKE